MVDMVGMLAARLAGGNPHFGETILVKDDWTREREEDGRLLLTELEVMC